MGYNLIFNSLWGTLLSLIVFGARLRASFILFPKIWLYECDYKNRLVPFFMLMAII